MPPTKTVTRKGKNTQPLDVVWSEVMGAAEVADALEIKVGNIKDIADLPAPKQVIRASRLWSAAEINAFVPVYNGRRAARVAAGAVRRYR